MLATEKDIKHIEELYAGRRAFHGEMHNHSASGGTSDGKTTLAGWRKGMEEFSLDFVAIVDHRQVRHMYQPEWEDGLFIAGTEPGTGIVDDVYKKMVVENEMHYNMIFESPKPLEEILAEFPEFEFEGGIEGHFVHPVFTHERMQELISAVKAKGGFFVHPHPRQCGRYTDWMDYYRDEEIGLEVFYGFMTSDATKDNYKLWTLFLEKGKHVWAIAGGDNHADPNAEALTTIYAENRKNRDYLAHLRVGDFVCGPVGIRMCVGDTLMGSRCKFEGKRLVVSVKDFHKRVNKPGHTFRVDILDHKGVVASETFEGTEGIYMALDADVNAKFYRAEVIDITENVRIGIGNPIWNE